MAATILFIASKVEQVYSKSCQEVITGCNLKCSNSHFLQLEIVVLGRLNFCVQPPFALQFLRRFSQVSDHMNRSVHVMAKFLIEKCLLSADCASWLPSLLAASCLYVSGRLFFGKQFQWTSSLEFYSIYTENQVRYHAVKVCNLIKCSRNWLLKATQIKFARKEYLNISACKQLEPLLLQDASFTV